ncbi:unnamed protein product [Arctogadus glacialis]
MSNAQYHNTHHKKSIWKQIGLILECPWDACQAKWKYLRDIVEEKEQQERVRLQWIALCTAVQVLGPNHRHHHHQEELHESQGGGGRRRAR